MLDVAITPNAPPVTEDVLRLFAALAQQCFINEYIFACSEDELGQVKHLQDTLSAKLQSGASMTAPALLVLAAYVPLHSLAAAPTMLARTWPEAIRPVLIQQIREPQEELVLRTTIPVLTPVEDGVSQQVREQYEENPYPRWVRLPPATPRASLDEHLRNNLPLAPYRSLGKDGRIHILIAGCGTGLQAIEWGRHFPNARILAVDLSLASLAYAKRKTQQSGLKNIEYAQADILKLGSLGRPFDVIDCRGVLHYMADPMAGWRTLLKLLQPVGCMHIGLYSELARQYIVAVRGLIAERRYRPAAGDIHRFRQEVLDAGDDRPLKELLGSGDFYTMSACRDLLFHVQEHHFSLPQIQAFLEEQRLRLLGFNLPDAVLQRYTKRFPQDRALTDLRLWYGLETENPYIFQGMYQFWVQRQG